MLFLNALKYVKSILKNVGYKIIYQNKIKLNIFKVISYKNFILDLSKGSSLIFEGKATFRNNNNIKISGGKLKIGRNVFFNNGNSINCRSEIIIGENTLFGEGVKIYDHDHKYKDTSQLIKNQDYNEKKIIIGSNVWIGSNVILLRGSIIGNNCVISAGSIIKGKIPDNSIVIQERREIIKKINRSNE